MRGTHNTPAVIKAIPINPPHHAHHGASVARRQLPGSPLADINTATTIPNAAPTKKFTSEAYIGLTTNVRILAFIAC